jgi:3-oxoacyl-[acyl-carrier protein] reductase
MVEQTLAMFGRIDILAHCAGVAPRKPVLEMSDEEWHQVLGINLDGTFYVARAVARPMVQRGSGTMILIASDRGTYGLAGGSHYSASKAGVVAFAKSLALELGPQGVTVNALNPGTTDTPLARGTLTDEEWQKRWSQDPLGRLSTPDDIAEIILFLAGPGGKIMTGQLLTTRMRFG